MTTSNQPLSRRVAIVTGAGKSLGRAYALHLASLGARIVVNNRGSEDPAAPRTADLVVDEIRCRGGEAVANYDSVEAEGASERLVACAVEHFGRLDIVVSNAGIDRASSFHKQDMADFEAVMRINFHSVAQLLYAAWLVDEECTVNGQTLISGAGHARLAQSTESETVDLGGDVPGAIATLMSRQSSYTPTSATGEFEDFTQSV